MNTVKCVLLIGGKVGRRFRAIPSRNWFTLLRLMVNMRTARQMVGSASVSLYVEAYMAMEDEEVSMPRDTGHRLPYSVDVLTTKF